MRYTRALEGEITSFEFLSAPSLGPIVPKDEAQCFLMIGAKLCVIKLEDKDFGVMCLESCVCTERANRKGRGACRSSMLVGTQGKTLESVAHTSQACIVRIGCSFP